MTENMQVTFWGVRGTVAVTNPAMQHYGGNTSCVEVRCGNRQIILDAGTGLYVLGQNTDSLHTDILLSHTHLDHIQGLPFYGPLHKPDSNVALWAGHLMPERTIEQVMRSLMHSPVFPLTLGDVSSRVEFNDFYAGEELVNSGFAKTGIRVRTMPLNHPDRATAYRIEYNNKAVCYVTDVEHQQGILDLALVEFIRDADVFIYDSTYDDDSTYPKYKGWGHSTWQEGVRLAQKAGVKTFCAFHHDPDATDDVLDARAKALEAMLPGSVLTREGLTLTV